MVTMTTMVYCTLLEDLTMDQFALKALMKQMQVRLRGTM